MKLNHYSTFEAIIITSLHTFPLTFYAGFVHRANLSPSMCILCGDTKVPHSSAGVSSSSSSYLEVSDEAGTLCKCSNVSQCEHCRQDLSADRSSKVNRVLVSSGSLCQCGQGVSAYCSRKIGGVLCGQDASAYCSRKVGGVL